MNGGTRSVGGTVSNPTVTARLRSTVAGALIAIALATGAAACDTTSSDSGAVTNLDEVGPQIAKLRVEVKALREEVRSLREEIALRTPTTGPTNDTSGPAR